MSEPLVVAAEELLERYAARALVAELREWEALRLRLPVPRYTAPASGRRFVTLEGLPGAGKTMALGWLQPALGARHESMVRFAEARGVTAEERRRHQRTTGQLHPADEAFLAELVASDAPCVVFEKFPRTAVEAATFLGAGAKHGWRYEVLDLQLPGDSVAHSVQRQLERGPRRGLSLDADVARKRALLHLARATSVAVALRSAGVPIHTFDMTRPVEENERALRLALGLPPAS